MTKPKNNVPFVMIIIMLLSILGTLLCVHTYIRTAHILAFYIGIIMGSIMMHFLVMHISAPIIFIAFRKKYHFNSFWFKPKKFEEKLYKVLKVRRWRAKVPTYNNDEYSLNKHTPEEIIMNMCHAEVVHEVIFITSYIPILTGKYIDHYWLLIITSFVFSICHLIFVIIQRYNRPRIINLMKRMDKRDC